LLLGEQRGIEGESGEAAEGGGEEVATVHGRARANG